MATALPILAAEDPTVKIIIGVIVAVFWIVSQIFGALTKKQDKRLPPSGRRPPGQPPVRSGGMGMPSPRQQKPPVQLSRQKPPPIRTQRRPAVAAPQPMTAPPIRRQPAAGAPKRMPRNDMLRALLKSGNLKKAYVLTEILQPPVSMRPSEERFG